MKFERAVYFMTTTLIIFYLVVLAQFAVTNYGQGTVPGYEDNINYLDIISNELILVHLVLLTLLIINFKTLHFTKKTEGDKSETV